VVKVNVVCRVARLVASDSFSDNNYSETTHIPVLQWLQLMFRFDLNFILEFVCIICSAFQFFTRKYCLRFSGLSVFSAAMSKPRSEGRMWPSGGFCAAQFRFSLWQKYPTY